MQDETLAREAAKIKFKREQNEKRRIRIHNAKQRTIGLDVEALDAQVAEKKASQNADQDQLNFERAQAMEIERILAGSMEEERQMKLFQMQQMKQSWADAAKKRLAEKDVVEVDFDTANSGPSSLLAMKGEDINKEETDRQKKELMRQWIQQQIAEKNETKGFDQEDDLNYADMIKAIDEIREATELEEKEMRKFVTDAVKRDNLELAMAQKMRRDAQNSINDENNGALSTSLDVFFEDRGAAMDEFGKVKRADMFRGFTEEQRRTIFQQNQDIIRDNAVNKMNNDRKDDEWVMQQAMAMRAMEQAAYEEQCMKDSLKEEHLEFLRGQIAEQQKHNEEWNKTKNGEIGTEFFESFGKDCR